MPAIIEMVTQGLFTALVKRHYSFLVEEFSFSFDGTTRTERVLDVYFTKGKLLVKVEYSYANKWIAVNMINNTAGLAKDKLYSAPTVALMHFVEDYERMMPGNVPLEDSVRLTAETLKNRCSQILSGEEWHTWQELTGFVREPLGVATIRQLVNGTWQETVRQLVNGTWEEIVLPDLTSPKG